MKKYLHIALIVLASGTLVMTLPACTAKEPPPASPEITEKIAVPSPAPDNTPDTDGEKEGYAPEKEDTPEQVSFTAEDGLEITADLYKTETENAPCIILFHMAESSRGEYAEIAPRLCEMGYNCLAVDQRSGRSVGGIKNLTFGRAVEKGLPTQHIEGLPDMRAALLYAKEELQAEKIILLGSSYSASLTFTLGGEYPDDVAAILAFSPAVGEVTFPSPEVDILADAANVTCPVFITVESGYLSEAAAEIFENVPAANKVYFRPEGDTGVHGSRVLNGDYANNGLYWEQVIDFLNSL